jgi:ABC-type sulfate transport system substrate-binding protein
LEDIRQAVSAEAEMESVVWRTHLLAEFPSARTDTKLGQKIHKNKEPIIEKISEW